MELKDDLAVFKACSDETRLRLLFLLSERELCVCELVSILNMPQGKVSRHLSTLKHAGLVSDRRDGVWMYYALTAPNTDLKQWLVSYLKEGRQDKPAVQEDLMRLTELADRGQICVPHPSAVSAIGSEGTLQRPESSI